MHQAGRQSVNRYGKKKNELFSTVLFTPPILRKVSQVSHRVLTRVEIYDNFQRYSRSLFVFCFFVVVVICLFVFLCFAFFCLLVFAGFKD